MPSLSPQEEQVVGLMLEEVWDLTASLDELERRREKLRDAILEACRRSGATRYSHPRGTVRVDRYESFRVPRPSSVLSLIRERGWEDDALTIRGRALHTLASRDPDAMTALRAAFVEQRHETLFLTPHKGRRRRSRG